MIELKIVWNAYKEAAYHNADGKAGKCLRFYADAKEVWAIDGNHKIVKMADLTGEHIWDSNLQENTTFASVLGRLLDEHMQQELTIDSSMNSIRTAARNRVAEKVASASVHELYIMRKAGLI